MNKNEEAYCKHDLNILSGENVDTESHYPVDTKSYYPKTQVSSMYGMMCDELLESVNEYPFGFILPDVEI